MKKISINKKKIFKGIFIISFIPYIALFGKALYHAIFGYDVYTWILPVYVRTIYGMEAFLEVFLWLGLGLCVTLIIPICFIYQIVYIIIKIKNCRKKKVNEF